ncbi:DUF3515 domain-containing protein [Streptomyces sp. TRM 70351]|uniref:DUF3515 domain-containing protein n=1 Tax=Streptomyces sp. TRM 70351 TaxID=3116552 RepID=UPI002E7B1150|nr:DUF3515 domain-containing protein [Streptomyces sp. TRM 70351]MEE1931173.1 DUF3515 domain-containing protein [Streptomyces sp. TRM 70351]
MRLFPRRPRPRRRVRPGTRRALLAAAAVAVLSATGCAGPSPKGPAVPSPSGAVAADCRALAGLLPAELAGQARVEREPVSVFTAVWGDPGIELRCGVPRPRPLTPGSEHYNPTADAVEVNGVSWLLEEREDGYRFTTTGRSAFVELTVPGAYAPEINALTALAEPVGRAVPERPL